MTGSSLGFFCPVPLFSSLPPSTRDVPRRVRLAWLFRKAPGQVLPCPQRQRARPVPGQRQSKRAPKGNRGTPPPLAWRGGSRGALPGSIPTLTFSSGGREAPRVLPREEEWEGCRWRRPSLPGAPKPGSHSGDNGTSTRHGAATHHSG